MYEYVVRPEELFGHILGDSEGFLVTFTGQQARLRDPNARPNELTRTRQISWPYPQEAEKAADYLVAEAQLVRESYFGVHLFREAGNRLATNRFPTIRCLWLDEDEGSYPEIGPEPTAIVRSSATRRHLYWQLTHAVSAEWAVSMNRRIAVWGGGDSGKARLSSVLRAPGTANFKRHPQVDLVVGKFTGVDAWEPEVLDQAVPEIPASSEAPRREPYDGPEIQLGPFLENVEVLGEGADSKGTKYHIVCPWVHEHSGADRTGTRIGQLENGALWFHCDHEHCQGRSWREFRRKVGRCHTVKSKDRPGFTGTLEARVYGR